MRCSMRILTSPWPGRRAPEPKVFLSAEVVRRGRDWYRSTYFAHATNESVLGEKSTSYLEDGAAATRAASVLGPAEIVVQLRDPVARAVSNWRFSTANGFEQRPLTEALEANLSGSRAWDRDASSVSPYAYLERGRYVLYLEPWLTAFAPTVHVRFLEDVAARRRRRPISTAFSESTPTFNHPTRATRSTGAPGRRRKSTPTSYAGCARTSAALTPGCAIGLDGSCPGR